MRDGSVPDEYRNDVSIAWRAAKTHTRAAIADEAVKLIVSAGLVYPVTKEVMQAAVAAR